MRTPVATLGMVVIVTLGAHGNNGWSQEDEPDPTLRVSVPIDGAPATGADRPLVTIVEFSDFYCPYCRRANATLATLLRIYPEDVRVVYRHSLLDSQNGTLAAESALAAAEQGKFWPMHDRLFAGPVPKTIDGLVAMAGEIGLDSAAVRAALLSRRHRDRLAEDVELAARFGISGVPVFFVNGRQLLGAQPLAVFVRLVEEERRLAAAMVANGTNRASIYAAMLSAPRDSTIGADDVFRRGVDRQAISAVGLGRKAGRRGGAEPLVTIVEFSDYSCGYCRRSHPDLLEALRVYGDDLRLVYRHFPLGPALKPVAEAAEAAGAQGKFWEFTDRIFSDAGAAHATRSDLIAHATSVGLELASFTRALDEHSYAKVIVADVAEAAALGVTGTPTMFINGRPVVGAPPRDALLAMIAAEAEAAKELLAAGVPRSDLYEQLSNRKRTRPR